MTNKSAIVLHSGGLDSTTCLAIAQDQGFTVHALAFDYGQRHSIELQAATNICSSLNIKQRILPLAVGQLGGSALTDNNLEVPEYQENKQIPITYVPARNLTFLSYAVGLAEVIGATDIFIGISAVDYSGYPDCRPEFIDAFTNVANLATKASTNGNKITIHTPLQNCSKAQTIQWGMRLGVNYAATISCYQANSEGLACGRCDSCSLRKKGFLEAEVADPTPYTK